jgi:serine/threonine protein kinase
MYARLWTISIQLESGKDECTLLVSYMIYILIIIFYSHRDLKPENLLLSDKSTEADIKIAVSFLCHRQ